MKKFFLPLLLLLLAIAGNLYASTVPVPYAQLVALNFFKLKMHDVNSHQTLNADLVYTKTSTGNTPDFYVFNINPLKGFVIVAADDNVIPILGYSTESNFKTDFNRIGLMHWMNKTSANIRLALQHSAVADARITNRWTAYRQGQNPVTEKSATISPLCTTTWDQENDVSNPPPYLYNLLCPYNSHQHQRCLTGCVATAMAQVMKYWNYPVTGIGSYEYDDERDSGYSYNYGVQSSNFAATTFQWALMPFVLTGNEPLAQDSAVDVLMYTCAVSVGMDFGDDNQDGSGANSLLSEELTEDSDSICTQYALMNYFLYNTDSMNGVYEANYTPASWTALIENELNVGRPVIYEGDDPIQGGHAWVCDGYDDENNLHMNWGWGGLDNGYFAINNLTTSGDFDPVLQDDALIGILPLYPTAPIVNFAGSLTGSCSGTVQFFDFSQDKPVSWLWNFGDGDASTQQNPVHTYAANGTYNVTLTATNPAGSSTLTLNNYITVSMLPAPTVTDVSATVPQSFSLSAGTANPVAWFDATGTLVSDSNPFVTPVLSSTTVYYVEDSVVSSLYHAGPLNDQFGGAGYITDPYAVIFNVLNSCVIQSVYVYAQNAANRTFQVADSSNNVVASTTVYCPVGGSRVTLNFNLNPGGPYYIYVADTQGLICDTSGAVYPYRDSAGLISITGNTYYNSVVYFYFYDWMVKSPDCTSPRVPVTIDITTGIAPLPEALSFNMFPNPANNEVILQTNATGNELIWNIKDILGQTLFSQRVEATQTPVNLANLADGIYLFELRNGEKSEVKKLVVSR